MKKSKVVISLILVILLLATVLCGLFACDFGSNNGGGGTTPTPDDDNQITVDPDEDENEDEDKTSKPTKPTRPTRPTRPSTDEGDGEGEGGALLEAISPYALLGQLMGGTQVEVQQDKKYRIVNLYIDAMSADQVTGVIKKKRFIFRTNIDQQGMSNNFAVQLVDLSNTVTQPSIPGEGGTIVSTEDGEIGISVSAAKLADDLEYEADGTIEWGFYAIDNKMYMDVGADKPLLYFEDFDMDYMKQILFAAKDLISDGSYDGSLQGPLFTMLNDLIGILTVDGILDLLSGFIFDTSLCITTTDPETGVITKDYSCIVKLNEFVKNIGSLVGLVSMLAGGALPFELNLAPLINFLNEWLPKMEIKILGQVVDGVTTQFELNVTRTDITDSTEPLYRQQIFGAEINTDRCYSDDPYDFGIPDRVKNNIDFEPFSLTNIALSLDIVLNSGGPVDLGSVINTFVSKELLPEGVLVLDVATGLRLDLALDLDLNYEKKVTVDETGKEVLIDKNMIMLELYLIDPITKENVDDLPLLGVYYKDGAAYVNVSYLLKDGAAYVYVSPLLKDYYAGNNIKINLEGVPDLIQYLVNLVTNALDGVFKDTLNIPDWVNWTDLRQSRLDEINKPAPAPTPDENIASAGVDDLQTLNVQDTCVALARNEHGYYQISMNLLSFLKGVGSVVGFGDVFGTNEDKTAIVITANQVFWDALNALANIQGFTWPGGLHAAVELNFGEKENGKTTLKDISIEASVDSRVGFTDADNNWYIGSRATYKKVAIVKDAKYYVDAAAEKELDLSVVDNISNYTLLYLNSDNNKIYLDETFTNEVMLIEDPSKAVNYIVYKDVIATNVNSSDIKAELGKKTIKAYVYGNEWVVGIGHDEGDYVRTGVFSEGLQVGISLHDIMLCYNSGHLKRFDPEYGGTNYEGYFGASSNLEGYILFRTHKAEPVELSATATGTYYVFNNNKFEEVEIGESGPALGVQYYQMVENGYVDSVSKFLTSILGGTFLSLNLTVDFSKGAYNLAPLISLFGLDALKDKLLLWEFSGDFKLDVNLNIAIALDKNNPDNSRLVVEIKVADDQDIVIGTGPDAKVLFGKGQTILGLYGVGKKIYVEVSNLRLLNIRLPDLYVELDYTTLIYSLIGEKEILDLTFNLPELLGLNKETTNVQEVASTLAQAEGTDAPETVDPATLIIDSNTVKVSITIAALQALLTSFGVDLGMNLNDVLKLAVDLVLNRSGGTTIDINGALLPKYEEGRGNYFDEDLHIGLQMGTTKAPVQIGDTTELMSRFEIKFATLAASTSQFHENIIDALIKVIGDLKLELTIDAKTLESVWDINRIVDTIVADQGDKFALPMQVNFDDWETQVKIVLQLYLDLNNFKNTQVLIELQFEGKVWIGLYIYRNSIVVDLNGLGLFDFELANSTVVAKAGNVLSNLLGSLGDLSLTTLLNGLIDDLLNPDAQAEGDLAQTEGEVAGAEGEVAQAEGEVASAEGDVAGAEGELSGAEAEKEASNDLIAMILGAISANDTAISLNLTSDVFTQLFRELLGFDIFLKLKVGAEVDLLEGTIGVGLDVEDGMVIGDIGIALGLGERGAYKFDMNLDSIPDWNAVNGEYLVRSLLKNLEIGLYIDLNQYTSSSGTPMYTRIYIEKLNAKKNLDNTDGKTAAKDSILVELAGIDEAKFNNSNKGTKQSWLYAELNWQEGKLYLNICKNFLKAAGIDIGNLIGTITIDLDLVNMLSGTIDGLLAKIEGLLDGLAKSETQEDLEQLAPVEEEVVDDSLANTNTTNGTISFTEIITSAELDRKTTVDTIGKYYFHNNKYYRVDASGDGAARKEITVDESTKGLKFAQLPQPSESLQDKIFMADEVVTEILDDQGNVTGTETSYSYYICLPVTRRVFAYYSVEVVSGISGFFSDLDIVSLFGKVTLSLTSTAILNADVVLDEYTINYVIDNLMYYIFGEETILNLQELTKDSSPPLKFSGNHLAGVHWDRVNKEAFWNELWNVIEGKILKDILNGVSVGLGGFSGIAGILKGTIEGIIDRLLPFAVGNDNRLGLNIVRGQLTNIYLTMHDNNTAIVDKEGNPYTFFNGKTTLSYGAGTRSDDYFTELHIFNTSPSVGNEAYTGEEGAVTWDGLPKSITYDPYKYAQSSNPYDEIYNKYFTNKVATYQAGQNLYKEPIQFSIISFKAEGEALEEEVTGDKQTISKENLGNLTTPGVYTIRATANFNSGSNVRYIDIKFTVESSADIVKIQDLSMSVYAEFPAYIMAYTRVLDNGEVDPNSVRRYSSDTLQFYTKSNGVNPDDGIKMPSYRNAATESGDFENYPVWVKFPNGVEVATHINFYNSTINEVIIANAKNNAIEIDLYQFDKKTDESTGSMLEKYMPEILYFYYPNGIADSIKVDEWKAGDAAELFDRLDPKSQNKGDVSAAEYTITAIVKKGIDGLEQEVPIKFVVQSKKVTSVKFGNNTNTLEIQPYEYYLYMSDQNKYAKYAPYQDKVTVNYDDFHTEEVYVVWKGTDSAIEYNWNNANNYSAEATVELDPNQYPSGDIFKWAQKVNVKVARNEIQTIYFDKALTKKNFEINPYVYNNLSNEDKFAYYPKTAFVEFTNGKIVELPIAWNKTEIENYEVGYTKAYSQFTVAIGHDYFTYEEKGEIAPFNLGGKQPFYQEHYVNVYVNGTEIQGVLLDGSELLGGVYYIDPIKVHYQNNPAFPNIVSVRYSNGRLGTVEVEWDTENDPIDINGGPVKQAKCYITNDLFFTINYQVLARGEDKMEIDLSMLNDPINPYSYTYDEKGYLTYEQFEKYLSVSYVTSYTVNLVDETNKIWYTETVETITALTQLKSYVKINYWNNDNKAYVVEEVIDGVVNTHQCKLSVEYNRTNYDLVAYWDVSKLQPTSLGGTKLVDLYIGYGSNYPIKKSVEVKFAAKKVKKLVLSGTDDGQEAIFSLAYKAENLTDAERLQAKVVRNLKVLFTDGTFEYVDCEIDLTTLNSSEINLNATTTPSHGYKSGIVYTTNFEMQPITVTDSTVGVYYLKGGYTEVELSGNNLNYEEGKYFTFTQANVTAGTEGKYYIRYNNNFVEINLTDANYNKGQVYYTRTEITQANYATFVGTAYKYDAEQFVQVQLKGFTGIYNADVQYYSNVALNPLYAKVTVAKAAGALRQVTQIKVYVE